MIMVEMNDINRTSLPQTTLANKRLKRFTERVTKVRQMPLLELSGDEVALDAQEAHPRSPSEGDG